MTVVTRIAPSPTGDMHIGTARTALFNYLYAKHMGGRFVLRVEDTDKERSTPEAVEVILEGMKWLGLDYDGEPVFQSANADRHVKVVETMVATGAAYRCYMTAEDSDAWKKANKGKAFRSPWRDRIKTTRTNPILRASETMDDLAGPFVVRLKVPEGKTVVDDLVKGEITFDNDNLDDIVLLRSDGAPTYNLAVVVDDHDMGVTHVIRGDDHVNNTPRQMLIYRAMGWDVPAFGHIPLIFNEEGRKLSKRDGAASIMDFDSAGYLPEAMRNYLTRLGWGHGEDEVFTDAEAIAWFDVKDVVSAPARMNNKKLRFINHHYIVAADNTRLAELLRPHLLNMDVRLNPSEHAKLASSIGLVKEGAYTLPELADLVLLGMRWRPDEGFDLSKFKTPETRKIVDDLAVMFADTSLGNWTPEWLNRTIHDYAEANGLGMGKIGPPLRYLLTGRKTAPDVGTLLALHGKDHSLSLIDKLKED